MDTATAVCAVALTEDGRPVVEYNPILVKTHSQRLVPLLDEALAEAGWSRSSLDAVAVGAGPGSFTGVRIGMSTAKAMAFALDLPLSAVSTLEATALSSLLPPADAAADETAAAETNVRPAVGELVCPLLDARRGEVYTALYRAAGPAELEEAVPATSPVLEDWLKQLPPKPVWFAGEGAESQRRRLQEGAAPWRIVAQPFLRGLAVALLGRRELEAGRRLDPVEALPRYVRRPQAEVLWEERRHAER
ncbi:MAG: tRNA (adenosine(37)-N6)-threonylcarbamoyltransferase complex dimerization subunit type 1 TsaB [Bacillota bacterium]